MEIECKNIRKSENEATENVGSVNGDVECGTKSGISSLPPKMINNLSNKVDETTSENKVCRSDRKKEIDKDKNKDTDSDNSSVMSLATGEDKCVATPDSCYSLLQKQLVKMHTTKDWWSLWIGLQSFLLTFLLVIPVSKFLLGGDEKIDRVRYMVPQPMKWSASSVLEAWDDYNIAGIIALFIIFSFMYLSSLWFMGKLQDNKTNDNEGNGISRFIEKPFFRYCVGFFGLFVIATIAFFIGRNEWCAKHGLGYAVWSIVFGMIIGNSPFLAQQSSKTNCLLLAAEDGEFFIKCSLVLLAVEFRVLGEVGLPAIIVAWIGSPVSLVAGYVIGSYVLKMDKSLALLISTGATWCGASAISAIGSVIESKPQDMSLCISLVASATVLFTFLQAWFAMAVGMDDRVAGAWIGGSVDQTGNVIASAAIISDEATEVAGVVKIVLNSGLGILASTVAMLWQFGDTSGDVSSPKRFSFLFLWDKFPKFILGYLVCSGVLTIVIPLLKQQQDINSDQPQVGDAVVFAISTMNRWWFAIAFVGIGITTNMKDLYRGAKESGIIQLYFITNSIDILISLGLAYLVF